MEWKHRHLFLILSLVVVVLLHENLNNFHKAFAQLQSTPLQLLAHMWSWTQQSCRKRPQASFLPYRETPSHSWCDISFPQLTISHLGLKLWSYTTEDSGSFALQFNLMTVARLYPLFSNLLGVFLWHCTTIWHLNKAGITFCQKFAICEPSCLTQIRQRSERAELEALHSWFPLQRCFLEVIHVCRKPDAFLLPLWSSQFLSAFTILLVKIDLKITPSPL